MQILIDVDRADCGQGVDKEVLNRKSSELSILGISLRYLELGIELRCFFLQIYINSFYVIHAPLKSNLTIIRRIDTLPRDRKK